MLTFLHAAQPHNEQPVGDRPTAAYTQTATEPPVDGGRCVCPVTGSETPVYGHIVEDVVGDAENHWWGCWACAGLYWTPDMPMPIAKSWHCIRVPLKPVPSPSALLAQLITEFEALRTVATAALAEMPLDPDYAAHLDELQAECRAVVETMREREAHRLPRVITIHP